MSIPRFSIKQFLFVNLVSVLIMVAGFIVTIGMNREVFPNVSFDIVTITTFYPGATPEDVEKLITVPIEKELKDVDGLKEFKSSSTHGTSILFVKIDPDESNKQKVIRDVQNAVDRVKDLPKDIKDEPLVNELTTKQYPIIEVSLSGKMSEHKLRYYADILEDIFEDIKGVARITKSGYRDREVQVLIDPVRMKEYYVSIDEIERALAGRNVSMPAGKLDTPTTEYSIRTTGEFNTAEEVEDVIIRANDSGNWLKISDVAAVEDTFEDENVINKTKGTRSINLVVVKKESGDAISIVKEVREKALEFQKRSGEGLEISFINDYSYLAKRRLNVLKGNAIVGSILVVSALLLFLEWKVALCTAVGIPISIFGTLIVMNAMGITINMISMFGLVVVLGMLVDDGIVVAENIYRHMEEGLPPPEAAVVGTEEVMGAVTSGVFTTIAAFSPLLFMSGIIGRFVRAIPIVIIVALIFSLLEAFTGLPSHMAAFVRLKRDAQGRTMGLAREMPWYKKLSSAYLRFLEKAIEHRYVVLGVFAAVFVSCVLLAVFHLKFILFPSAGINYFFVRVETPIGTPLEKTNELLVPIEEAVGQLPAEELESYVTMVGQIQEDRHDPYGGQASHLGQITVYLTQEQDRKRDVDEIIAGLRPKMKDVTGFTDIRFDRPQAGPPVGKAVEAQIRGEKFETLDEIAKKYMDQMAAMQGTTDITWDHKPGKEEIRVKIDMNKAAVAGLSVAQIAKTVRAVFEGGIATKIKPVKAEEETDVTVRFAGAKECCDVKIFEDILVENKNGKLIPLKKVSSVEKVPGSLTIHHLDGKRVVTASCNVDTQKTTSLNVNMKLARIFKDISRKYIGYGVKYGGEQEESIDSLLSLLRAFLFASMIIYLMMASFFKSLIQPVIVMLAIPFGFIGVVIGFALHGISLSFMAILGIIGLAGIVVNDSIVLVDFINKSRLSGMSRRESIMKGCHIRFRAILLANITTIGGLSTVAYGIGGKDPFLVPMAMALCWGLIFSSTMNLTVIPCVYSILDDIAIKLTHHTSIIGCDTVNVECPPEKERPPQSSAA